MFNIKSYDCLKSSQEIRQWYEKHYHLLSLAGLWLKGEEPNTMEPALFAQAKVRFLICRLSTYRDVTPSISHSLVAQIAQEVEGVFTDFAFLPPPKDMEVMTASKIPLWVGTTTKEPPCTFDVLGISNSFILELLNLPKLLHYSGIPLFKTERMKRPDVPLIILGGASAAVTSVLHGPIREQGFEDNYGLVDAVFIGEGEFAIKQFLEIVKKGKLSGCSKTEILRECHGKVDGFYEPDKYEHRYRTVAHNINHHNHNTALNPSESFLEKGGLSLEENNEQLDAGLVEIVPTEPYVAHPVKSAVVYDLDKVRTLESGPLWYEAENLGVGTLQISNGCPCFCSFCAESWERKPYRELSLEKLLEGLRKAKAHQGLDTINLLSFNFNTHAELYPLILSFYKEIANISLKSQRFDLLSTDRFLAEVQQIIGKTTVSCGMEGISERLRRCLHKNLTEVQIYTACEFLFERGIRELKVFLINTGLEQDNDFLEFGNFVKRLADLKSMSDSKVRIIFSLTPLYYPPHTPLQFHGCLTAQEDNKWTIREIERICKFHGMEFRESAAHEETWLMQLLAMGDRRLTPALIRSSITDDFVYYNGVPKQVVRNWRASLTELGLSEERYFCDKEEGSAFPWDDIDTGISKKFLWDEYEQSTRFMEREYCLGRPDVDANCLGCGACPSGAHIKKITHHKISPPFLLEELNRITTIKQKRMRVRTVVEIDASMHLVPKRFMGNAIARALMLAMPEITPYYYSLSGHLREIGTDKPATDLTYGINVYDLVFLLNDTTEAHLNHEALMQNTGRIQQHCRGFQIKEFTDPHNPLDVKYILYRLSFAKMFTAPYIEQKLGEYLHANYVKHTLLKRDDRTIYKVDAKNKKNVVIIYARIDRAKPCDESEAAFSIVLVASTRFDIHSFLEACYGFERRKEIVLTNIETLGYYGKNPVVQKHLRCSSCNDYIQETALFGESLTENHCLTCSVDKNNAM